MATDIDYETVKVDDRGRITLPKSMRQNLEIKKGETLFARREGQNIELAKTEINPFGVLAEHAAQEHQKGETRIIREPGQKQK